MLTGSPDISTGKVLGVYTLEGFLMLGAAIVALHTALFARLTISLANVNDTCDDVKKWTFAK